MFGIAQKYIKSGPNGFVSGIVTGKRRIGKTMYSMQNVYQICRYERMSEKKAWEEALNSIIFTMNDLIKVIKKYNYQNRKKFLIWDDAGVYGGSMLYLYQVKNAMVLKSLMDVIGTKVKLLLLTCPDSGGLMKFLRRYSDYLIRINIAENTTCYDRNALVSEPYWAKNCNIRWRKAWTDEFNVGIPDWVYNAYVKTRDDYAETILKGLLEYGEKGREVARETYGEIDELVRQDNLLDSVVSPNNEGDDI